MKQLANTKLIYTILGSENMLKDKSEESLDQKDNIIKKSIPSEKTMEIIGSVGTASALTTLLTAFLGPECLMGTAITITGGTILLSPSMYFGMQKLKNKLEERTTRDMQQATHLSIMLQEEHEKERIIGSLTALFLNEILDVFEIENPNFPQDQIMNINQFIYLINSNYYEKIQKYFPKMSRDILVRKIVEQISIYLNDTKTEKFDENTAVGALAYCIFIPATIKKEIILEFKRSKLTVLGTTTYEIIRNDISTSINEYIAQKQKEKNAPYNVFDIDSETDYYELILSYIQDPYYIEKGYGDPYNIDWNVSFLKKVIKIIVRDHRKELLEKDPHYSNFRLTASLVENSLMYALINNKEQVGPTEIINTFKNWDYLPFNVELSVLDTLFTEENIDFANHPFGISKKSKEKSYQKIIEFKPKFQDKSD